MIYLTLVPDDAIVVAMTTKQYLYDTEETNRIRELAWGVLREPPAPFFSHQSLVLRIARLLGDHAEPRKLGRVAVAPVDVILDRERALIVQPDVLFVTTGRLSIIQNQVWGPPDLVAEVLSFSTENRDRGEKLGWYQQYGVRECWLVDLNREQLTIVDFSGTSPVERVAKGPDSVRSTVLPQLEVSGHSVFA
jgi:Uma2 family endonuclease